VAKSSDYREALGFAILGYRDGFKTIYIFRTTLKQDSILKENI